jgi:hypothetical protein
MEKDLHLHVMMETMQTVMDAAVTVKLKLDLLVQVVLLVRKIPAQKHYQKP